MTYIIKYNETFHENYHENAIQTENVERLLNYEYNLKIEVVILSILTILQK